MDYKEIKDKYLTASAERISQRTRFQAEYDRAKRNVDEITAKVEGLRPRTGIMTAEDSQAWDKLLFEKNNAMRELRKAQINLQKFDSSDLDINNITEIITH